MASRDQFYQAALLLCIVFALGVHTGLQIVAEPPPPETIKRSLFQEAPPRDQPPKAPPPPPPPPPEPPTPSAKPKTRLEAATTREVEVYEERTAKGEFATYLASGRGLPVVLLACNRPEALRSALTSLLRDAEPANVAIVQDGTDAAVADVAREFGLTLQRNGLERVKDGAARIARNYKYALGWALDEHFTDAPGVIVVEDDLLFSPDFIRYFEAVSPLLDHDPSVFVLSAWNDNGFFEGADPRRLMRTQYFPGLGWLLSRRLWATELRDKWPSTHWDHWLRNEKQHKGRESVFPMVPRTFHAGAQGTFMDSWHHNRYFAPVKFNTDESVNWTRDQLLTATADVYEARLKARFLAADHVDSFHQLDQILERKQPSDLVFWYSWKPDDGSEWQPPNFACLSERFHLWHEHQRANHYGLHEAFIRSVPLLLVNARESHRYARFMPAHIHPFSQADCERHRPSWADMGRSG